MLASPSAARALAGVYRALGACADAGLPPLVVAATLDAERGQPAARRAAVALAAGLRTSGSLAAGARDAGLPADHVAVLAVAERTGTLPRALKVLVQACETEARRRARSRKALLHPFVLFAAFSLIGPLPLIVTGGVGAYVAAVLGLIAAPVALGLFASHVARRAEAGSQAAVRFLGSLPGLSDLLRTSALVRLHRTWVVANAAGLPALESLDLAGQVAGPLLRRDVAAARAVVQSGGGLAEALAAGELLPGITRPLAAEADATGRPDRALEHAATLLEDELEARTRRRITIAGAVAYALVVLAIAARVISGFTGGT